ncbi:MAG: hypothetical protein ACRDEA_03560 [Microcystaceae cyanobacterium]
MTFGLFERMCYSCENRYEKHSWRLGERIYIPTTVAVGCFLGVDVTERVDTQALMKSYGHFQAEARALEPHYQPETVNTDGWEHMTLRACCVSCIRS